VETDNDRAIQISWLAFVFPCLLLTYIGQAAYISDEPHAYLYPFFNTVPPGMYWPGIIISILAAVIASQAIITATFQLVYQIMALSYFPNARLKYTSTTFYGQVYIPVANWLLMIGTLIVTALFKNVSLAPITSLAS
jgi:KUP system potassium uptake protein